MSPTTAEVTAARVVAVFVLERFIRARSALVVWGSVAIAALFWFGAFASHGFGAVVIALFALVASTVAITLLATRSLVLRAIRRVGGGPHYARLRPIVAKRVKASEQARAVVPFERTSTLRLMWMARRPRILKEHIQEAASTIATTVPDVVNDVRRELGPSVIDV